MSFADLASLDGDLARLDDLQERVDLLKAVNPDAYASAVESWLVAATYHSNSIEGSTLSLGDTALVREGAKVDAPADDIHAAEGGFAAAAFLDGALTRNEALSEALIKRVHELVFAEAKDLKTRGQYRNVEVEITGTPFEPAPVAYVPERMKALVESVSGSKRHPAIVAALFHLEFESIHPFVNANGRTGRLISNFILQRAGFEPVAIPSEARARYIGAIQAFQINDDPFPFADFFVALLIERLEHLIALLSPTESAGRPGNPTRGAIASYLQEK